MDAWGTVCDDSWQINDASVACRQLGFPYGASRAITQAGFGMGTGQIWLDDLYCGATQTNLFSCNKGRPTGSHNCDHSEDAGAICIPVREFWTFIVYHVTISTCITSQGL